MKHLLGEIDGCKGHVWSQVAVELHRQAPEKKRSVCSGWQWLELQASMSLNIKSLPAILEYARCFTQKAAEYTLLYTHKMGKSRQQAGRDLRVSGCSTAFMVKVEAYLRLLRTYPVHPCLQANFLPKCNAITQALTI